MSNNTASIIATTDRANAVLLSSPSLNVCLFLTSKCKICVIACVSMCFAWEVVVCFVYQCLLEPFLYICNHSAMLNAARWCLYSASLRTLWIAWTSWMVILLTVLFISYKFVKRLLAITALLLLVSSWNLFDMRQHCYVPRNEISVWSYKKKIEFPNRPPL